MSCRKLTINDISYLEEITDILQNKGFVTLKGIYDNSVIENVRKKYSLENNIHILIDSLFSYYAHFTNDNPDGILIGEEGFRSKEQQNLIGSKIYWVVASMPNQGIGSELINYFISQAIKRHEDFVTLVVHENNPAINLYNRLGFEKIITKNGMIRMDKYIN